MWYVSLMATDRLDTFVSSLGFESYRVGGSVRDHLLGRKIKDCDYMVRDATLNDIYQRLLGSREAATVEKFAVTPLKLRDGRQAGWRVAGRGLGLVEIVLPRTEVSTGPGHRDFEIVLSPSLSLEQDAQRRDFTFNALYYGPLNGADDPELNDPLGGVEDLMRRRVQVTHADSFRDDPLRILRALRFLSTLDYELSGETYALMCAHADAVTGLTQAGVSGTVIEEFSKLLMGQNPAKALRVARDTGVLAVALPELAPMLGFAQGSRYHDLTTDEHTFEALTTAAHVDAPLRVRWALLFHDAGKPSTAWRGKDGRKHYYSPSDAQWEAACIAAAGEGRTDQFSVHFPPKPVDHEVMGETIWREAIDRLNGEKRLRDDVAILIRNHMVGVEKVNPVKVRRERVRLGDSLLRDLYLMRLCDLSGKGKANRKHMENVGHLEGIRQAAVEAGVPCSPKDLLIDGNDLKAEGIQGKAIGDALRGVLDEVVCQPSGVRLDRDWQLDRARKAAA
jgi:tRNA nucleotidyltransferase (CCA-adding enzyme)